MGVWIEGGWGEVGKCRCVGAEKGLGEGVGCGEGGGGEARENYGDFVGEEGAVEKEGGSGLISEDGVGKGVEDGGDKVGEERVGVILDNITYI